MSEGQWLRVNEAARYYNISNYTVRKWADLGKLPSRRTPTNQRQIQIIENSDPGPERTDYIYVRVSSYKQKDDLARQKTFLSQKFPFHSVISDVGSGLNFKRRGLISLLEHIQDGTVGQIVVTSRDRLCRFGFELIEEIARYNGSKILVLEHNDDSPEGELAADLLDIVQVFCCRRNGKRRYKDQTVKNPVETEPSSEEDST